jgi:hypothetical protein
MKSYLAKKIGQKIGVTRVGIPKEVYFEALLKEVNEEVAVFVADDGAEIALALDKVLVVGPLEIKDDKRRTPGFAPGGSAGHD